MSALIIEFAAEAAVRRQRKPASKIPAGTRDRHPALSHDFMFWSGASGASYVHTVYALLDCPDLPAAVVVLVRRTSETGREAVHVMRVEHDAPSLNLAEVRMTAARLGASEVHVHLLATSSHERSRIESDIAARHLDRRAAG